MTVAPQADTETVTGVVTGVVQKAADKWQVEVNVGAQNPRRLWTKDAELVQQMMGLLGQTLSFMCGKSHWTNAQNQPVTSLWINGYGAAGSFPQAQPVPVQPVQNVMQQPVPMPMPQQFPQPQPVPVVPATVRVQDDTEAKIHRQTATKVASNLLKHLPVEEQNFENLLKISERLVHYYDHGVSWPQANPASDGDPGPQGIPHSDDEIPF